MPRAIAATSLIALLAVTPPATAAGRAGGLNGRWKAIFAGATPTEGIAAGQPPVRPSKVRLELRQEGDVVHIKTTTAQRTGDVVVAAKGKIMAETAGLAGARSFRVVLEGGSYTMLQEHLLNAAFYAQGLTGRIYLTGARQEAIFTLHSNGVLEYVSREQIQLRGDAFGQMREILPNLSSSTVATTSTTFEPEATGASAAVRNWFRARYRRYFPRVVTVYEEGRDPRRFLEGARRGARVPGALELVLDVFEPGTRGR